MPYSLGAGQGSKSACLYQIKYMAKECVEIASSASVLVEAYNDFKKYPSTADDAGTMERDGKFFCQHLINLVTMEMDGLQAASLVSGLRSSERSDSIIFFSGWDVQRLACIVEQGHTKDINFSNGVIDDDDTHEMEDDSDDEVAEMERAVPTEEMIGDRHPHLPSIDLLNRLNPITDTEFDGYAKVFRTELGENVPVSTAHHYMHRDLKLWRFSAYEFMRLFSVRKMTKEDQKWYDAITSNQPSCGRGSGRACHRFLLLSPHPLCKSHILVPRAKCGVPAFAGPPPPKDVPSLLLTPATSRKRKRFALFFASNLMPWSAAQPPVLTYASWTNYVNTLEHEARLRQEREPDITESTTHDDKLAIESAKRSRYIAAGRLFDIENITNCFKAKHMAVLVLARYRARSRTMWSSSGENKPRCFSQTTNAHRAANAIRKLQDKANRILCASDQPARHAEAAWASQWAKELQESLLYNDQHTVLNVAAPERLQHIWKKAAFPNKLSLKGGILPLTSTIYKTYLRSDTNTNPNPNHNPIPDPNSPIGGIRNPDTFISLLKKPIVLYDIEDWTSNGAAVSTQASFTANPHFYGDTNATNPFRDISDIEYELEAKTHNDLGLSNDNAPMNPEQRACGRAIMMLALLKKDLTSKGYSPSAMTEEYKRVGLHQVVMMTGIPHPHSHSVCLQ